MRLPLGRPLQADPVLTALGFSASSLNLTDSSHTLLSISTCSATARHGHIEVLQWIRGPAALAWGGVCEWGKGTCSYAALGGQLEALKWLREHECPW